jgi:hypothetical protein
MPSGMVGYLFTCLVVALVDATERVVRIHKLTHNCLRVHQICNPTP